MDGSFTQAKQVKVRDFGDVTIDSEKMKLSDEKSKVNNSRTGISKQHVSKRLSVRSLKSGDTFQFNRERMNTT